MFTVANGLSPAKIGLRETGRANFTNFVTLAERKAV